MRRGVRGRVQVEGGPDRTRAQPPDRTEAYRAIAVRAEEPMPFTAHVAGRGVQIDGIAFRLPFPASIPVAIVQDHTTRFRPDIDRACNFAATGPRNATAYPCGQKPLAFQPPNINRTVIFRCVCPELPVSPATNAAHAQPQILPKSFESLRKNIKPILPRNQVPDRLNAKILSHMTRVHRRLIPCLGASHSTRSDISPQ
jgi:hypothetical protein